MHYAMLDRAESGETRLNIHLYGHTIDHTEYGSPCIKLRVRETNRLGIVKTLTVRTNLQTLSQNKMLMHRIQLH